MVCKDFVMLGTSFCSCCWLAVGYVCMSSIGCHELLTCAVDFSIWLPSQLMRRTPLREDVYSICIMHAFEAKRSFLYGNLGNSEWG
jgi:hypothetical protein